MSALTPFLSQGCNDHSLENIHLDHPIKYLGSGIDNDIHASLLQEFDPIIICSGCEDDLTAKFLQGALIQIFIKTLIGDDYNRGLLHCLP